MQGVRVAVAIVAAVVLGVLAVPAGAHHVNLEARAKKSLKQLAAPMHSDGAMPEEPLNLLDGPSLALLPDCRVQPSKPCLRYCPPSPELGQESEYPCRVENISLSQDGSAESSGSQYLHVDTEDLARTSAARSPVCAADPHLHILYATTRGSGSYLDQRYGEILGVLSRSNARLHRDSYLSATGGYGGVPAAYTRAQYKVLCRADGKADIQHVYLSNIDANNPNSCGTYVLDCVRAGVRAAGHISTWDKYLVFVELNRMVTNPNIDGQLACGEAERYADERTAAQGNIQAQDQPMYGAIYLAPDKAPSMSVGTSSSSAPSVPPPSAPNVSTCMTSQSAMHEIGHNMGAVQAGAPHFDAYNPNPAHCNELNDVLCWGYQDSTKRNHTDRCARNSKGEPSTALLIRFDCRFDDYFNLNPADDGVYPSAYLRDHWNIGDSGNGYLQFSN